MRPQTTTSRFFRLRVALVFATLLSLCVSNNVGPSFLPLPVVTGLAAENRQDNQQKNTASRPAPSSAESDSLRVPMLAQSQKRADKDQPTQPLVATLKASFIEPDPSIAIAETNYLISPVTSPSVSQPPGRAPPLS